jgi:hypothetical protein
MLPVQQCTVTDSLLLHFYITVHVHYFCLQLPMVYKRVGHANGSLQPAAERLVRLGNASAVLFIDMAPGLLAM